MNTRYDIHYTPPIHRVRELEEVVARLRAENERLRAAICELFIYRVADEIPCYASVTPRDLSHVSPQIKETLWAVLRAAEAAKETVNDHETDA